MTLRTISVLLGLMLLPAVVYAQQPQPPEFVGISVGFADRYKAGVWTPVELTLRGGSQRVTGRVSVTVADNDGTACEVESAAPCQVLPGQNTSVTLYVRFGHADNTSLHAQFHIDGGKPVSKTFETSLEADTEHFRDALTGSPSQGLIVHVGRNSATVEEVASLNKVQGQPRMVVARVTDVDRLPARWYGYEGVDTIVLSTSRPETYRTLTPESGRIQAIDQWVRLGGKLVLCVGSQGDEILHKGSPLAQFAPGQFDRMVTLRQTSALETYAKSANPIPSSESGGKGGFRVPKLSKVEGKIEASEADVPLVVRAPHGLGQVIFVAADLDQAPLGKWADRRLFAARLLDQPTSDQATEENNLAMQYGFSDLAGQLRSSLDQFTGVHLVPFFAVALLVVVYILLIGPGDYFFLRHIVGRMAWTWLTFPLIVLLFTGGAYVTAYWLKGNQLRIHQVDIVDVDAAGRMRGSSWFNVFSPRMETFDLSIEPRMPGGKADGKVDAKSLGKAPDGARSLIAWMGVPGDGMGGMYRGASRGGGPTLWNGHYGISPSLDKIEGVPIQVWSTKSFTSRWWTDSPSSTKPVESSLVEEEPILTGTITNKLDIPLVRCFLAYDRWAYQLDTIEPGGSVELSPTSRRQELQTLVTGREEVVNNQPMKHVAPVYNPSSRDPMYVLQEMMFFDAIGGARDTGLSNDYQGFVDLSGLLKAGQAILVAFPPDRSEHCGARVLRDGKPINTGQDQHTTVYRFVLPVTVKK